MTDKQLTEVIEGNKLIAKFMGFEGQHEDWCGNNILEESELMGDKEMRPYKPHERWDDLMPVVEKIGELCIKNEFAFVNICTNGICEIEVAGIYYEESAEENMIKATWQTVVQFIQWYNQNKQS